MPSVIEQFEAAARAKDIGLVRDLFADSVRLYGLVWQPFEGKEAALGVLAMVQELLEHHEFVAEYEGRAGVVLLVRGRVGGREFDGVQVLTFNDQGLIEECRDLIRPYSAATALKDASAAYMARQAPAT